MENKKRNCDQISEGKILKRSSYNNRKECIKKKTMELAILCGIDACTIIYGADGEIESWPENPTVAKAIIKNFKDLTDDPYKKTAVRDESQKKVIDVPGGEVESWPENPTAAKAIIKNFEYMTNNPYKRTIHDESQKKVFPLPKGEVYSSLTNPRGNKIEENAESVNLMKMMEKSLLYSNQSSDTEFQEFLKQLDSKLEALTKRIEFLRINKQYDADSCSMTKLQLYYSENTSQKRIKISETPKFQFDLNYPPPDEVECSSLSSEDYDELGTC